MRAKLVEYETDNERLKRQLTNERFERERAAQELRKLSESSDISSSVRFTRSISPTRAIISMPPPPPIPLIPVLPPPLPAHGMMPPPPPPPPGSGSAAAAAVAAAAAAVAASNVAYVS